MNQTAISVTQNQNCYIYDNVSGISMLIHPDLKCIHENDNGTDYYKKKYEYLKKHHFFSNTFPSKTETIITESMIRNSIIHTPQLLFEVTDCCNLKCTYCALGELYQGNGSRNSQNINLDSAKKLLKYILDLKIQNNENKIIISFYGGEPLVNFYAIKQIIMAAENINSEQKIAIGYNMTTNAMLLDKYIDFLVKHQFSILISLDGNEANNDYRITKDNQKSFFKVISNLDKIKKKYPYYFEEKINFNSVLHNKNSVKSIYEFIYKKYNKKPQISELNTSGVNIEKKSFFQQLYRNRRKSESEYSKEKNNLLDHRETIIFHELINFLKYFSINSIISNVLSSFRGEEKHFPACTCIPFSKRIFLTTNNTLLPCERIDHKYFLGAITENVEIDIANIAKLYTDYYQRLECKCAECYLVKFCGVCMFHIEHFDQLKNKDIVCGSFHDLEKFQNKLQRIYTYLEDNPNDYYEILENLIMVS